MKSQFNATKIKELQNIKIGSRSARISSIITFRSKYSDAENVRKLAGLAAHSVATQERNYNYAIMTEEMVEIRRKLKETRSTIESVQEGVR